MKDVLPLCAAFSAGIAVELVNFLITRSAINGKKDVFVIFPLRTIIAGAFLAALYFTVKALGLDVTACMIAGAVGASVGLVLFMAILMRNNRKGGGKDG